MSDVVIKVDKLWKEYRLGSINHGTLRRDLQSWWARLRGRDDPNRRVDDRATSSEDGERFWALRDVSFEVRQGEVLGIIGKNGAGKSTLLKILSRVTTPTRGGINVRGRIASLLEVGTGFHPELTGRENIFLNGAILGMNKADIRRNLDDIIAFAEVERFIDTPVKRYSSGMYVRLAFAVAAHLESEILVVDEVLAVGDIGFQKKCLGKMGEVAKVGRTVLFVSHNMAAVQKLCPQTVLLKHGVVSMVGASGRVVSAYVADGNSLLASPSLPRGFRFYREAIPDSIDFAITGIQVLDSNDLPIDGIVTWNHLRFRFHYLARTQIKRGAVEFTVSSPEGVTLLRSSTTPDWTMPMSLSVGRGAVDCVIDRFPLSAGTYVVSAGLAVPMVEYLCWEENLCSLEVGQRDVFGTGLPPTANRYLFAENVRWKIAHLSDSQD